MEPDAVQREPGGTLRQRAPSQNLSQVKIDIRTPQTLTPETERSLLGVSVMRQFETLSSVSVRSTLRDCERDRLRGVDGVVSSRGNFDCQFVIARRQPGDND